MIEKILYTAVGNYISSFEMWFRLVTVLARKYWPFWVSVLVSDISQSSGFGRTLVWIVSSYFEWNAATVAYILGKASMSIARIEHFVYSGPEEQFQSWLGPKFPFLLGFCVRMIYLSSPKRL